MRRTKRCQVFPGHRGTSAYILGKPIKKQPIMNTELNSIKGKKVLVIGDVMLDTYHIGDVKRISPEAPVPVVRVTRTYNVLGGAANVARNLLGLGCSPYVLLQR